jgi:arsenite methyltransferase
VISDIYSIDSIPDEYRNDPVAVAECWGGAVTRAEYLKQIEKAGFIQVNIVEESVPYEKGKTVVSSWTIAGKKPTGKCSCYS